MTDQPPHYVPDLTVSQAARALSVSPGTIRRWSDLGYLHGYRTPGGQRRFNQRELDQFLQRIGARPRPTDQ